MSIEKIQINTNTIIFAFVIVCLFSLPAFTACTLRIDPDVIEQCKETCGKFKGVKKVSAFQCVCNEISEDYSAVPMVLQ